MNAFPSSADISNVIFQVDDRKISTSSRYVEIPLSNVMATSFCSSSSPTKPHQYIVLQNLLNIPLPSMDQIHRPQNEADMDYFPTLGVSVTWLCNFVTKMQSFKNTNEKPFHELTTTDVCEDIVKPFTNPYTMSMCDLLHQTSSTGHNQGIGKATVFISHAWKYRFVDLVDALKTHFIDTMDTIVWFDVFSVNQHSTGIVRDFSWWSGTFQNAIKQFNRTVMVLSPWHDPIPLTRAWCLWELYSTIKMECTFEVAMSLREKQVLLEDLEKDCHRSLNNMKGKINVEKSESWDPNDRQQIGAAIIASGITFNHLNSEVFKTLNAWIIALLQSTYDSMVVPVAADNDDNDDHHLHLRSMNTKRLKAAETLAHAYQNHSDYINSERYFKLVYDERLRKTTTTSLSSPSSEEGEKEDEIALLCASHNLADIYLQQGKDDLAERLCQSCYHERCKLLGKTHVDTLDSMALLGTIWEAKGKYDDAISLHKQCLELKQGQLGDKDLSILESKQRLAVVYYSQEKYEEALPLYIECFETKKQLLGEQHPETLSIMHNLALLYRMQEKNEEALSLLQTCLEIYKIVGGERHHDTISALSNIALIYSDQEKYDDALVLYEQCLEISKVVLGEQHPETLIFINNIAEVYQSLGKYDEALLKLYLQCWETAKIVYGNKYNGITSLAMSNIVSLYKDQGNLKEALSLCKQSLEIQKKEFGEQHIETLFTMNELANLYQLRGKFRKAVRLFVKCLALRKQALGDHHIGSIATMADLASLYMLQGKFRDASLLYAKCVELSKAQFGEDHDNTKFFINAHEEASYEFEERKYYYCRFRACLHWIYYNFN